MRSSILLSAICAATAMGNPLDKRVYETDWSVVTVTETVTDFPPATTSTSTSSTPTYAPVQAIETSQSVSSADTVVQTSASPAPAPAVYTTIVAPAPAEPTSTTTEAPAAAATIGGGEAVTFSTAWTWTGDAAAPTTLATSTSSASGSSPTNAYQSAILYNHNVHRSNHSASSLEWSASLESSARTLANKCVYQHDTSIDGGGYGQNIGYGVEADNIGQMISNLMYNDEMGYFANLYGQANPDMSLFDSWGHFTQIVWKASTAVGCATVTCQSLGNVDSSQPLPFTVCNYNPAGNYDGEYNTNVLQPLGQAMYSA
ncbi:hypothetical protein ASPWEDRAFT_172072 [Aspergillus wentii DTO 134E9]|uniref:SCP domain-containing protein n=1 Tax=Aspergillus wentii DTO 134E9 TaxID=1073089 RepID=A0A1L9RJZ5_ASPWE|nr:uncharacterized protein ASPWEDRAFT_172072 [Aspergillus wentii DTO 134E9]KAI9923610.1 hypothetical protein MW887_008532 [Aspergillus wentii]OJJ35250.1 hypothetical protein ASPWEDRAFT_172072 [Aspergillus wentii DTO 134E9]